MKLKNKILLPLFTVGAAASVATPLLVSCGVNQNAESDIYIPTIPKAVPQSEEYSLSNAWDLYYKHVFDNNEIFEQDLRCYASGMSEKLNLTLAYRVAQITGQTGAPLIIDSNIKLNFDLNFKNLEIGKNGMVTIIDEEGDPVRSPAMFVSFDLDFDFNYEAKDEYKYIFLLEQMSKLSSNKSTQGETFSFDTMKLKGCKLHFVDVPFAFGYQESSSSLFGSLQPGTWFLSSVPFEMTDKEKSQYPWSIQLTIESGYANAPLIPQNNLSYSNDSYSFDNYSVPEELMEDAKIETLYNIVFTSLMREVALYHMSDIKYSGTK